MTLKNLLKIFLIWILAAGCVPKQNPAPEKVWLQTALERAAEVSLPMDIQVNSNDLRAFPSLEMPEHPGIPDGLILKGTLPSTGDSLRFLFVQNGADYAIPAVVSFDSIGKFLGYNTLEVGCGSGCGCGCLCRDYLWLDEDGAFQYKVVNDLAKCDDEGPIPGTEYVDSTVVNGYLW